MDAALRHHRPEQQGLEGSSFNPCFDGCRPATHHPQPYSHRLDLVSILVLMDAALRRIA